MRSAHLVVGFGLALSLACSGKTLPYPGGLMLAVQTDLSAPKDVAAVGLFITSDGRPIFTDTRAVAPNGEVKFPATIAVIGDEARPQAVVKVRAVAFKSNGDVRVLRDVVTTIPRRRTALLRMPLLWINEGSGHLKTGSGGTIQTQHFGSTTLRPLDVTMPAITNGFSDLESACPDGQTFLQGECGDANVDSSALPDYAEAEVFGGGNAEGEGGRCFDVLACFQAPVEVTLDKETCTATVAGVDPNDPNLSLAIVLPPSADAGECAGDKCFVPLDKGAGWTVAGAAIQLPKPLCKRIADGKAKGIAASRTCPAKDPATPSCGAASSVGATPGPEQPNGDAGNVDQGQGDFTTPGAFGPEPSLSAVAITDTAVFVARSTQSPPPAGVVKLDRGYVDGTNKDSQVSVVVAYSGDGGPAYDAQVSTLVLAPNGQTLVVRGANGPVNVCKIPTGDPCTPFLIDGPRGAVTVGSSFAFAWGTSAGEQGVWKLPVGGGTPSVAAAIPPGTIVSSMASSDAFVYFGTIDGSIYRCTEDCMVPSDAVLVRPPSDPPAPVIALTLTPANSKDGAKFVFALGQAEGATLYELGLDGSGEQKVVDALDVAGAIDEADAPPIPALAADSEYIYWGGAFDAPQGAGRRPGLLRRRHGAKGPIEPFIDPVASTVPVSSVVVDGKSVYWTYNRQDSALVSAQKLRSF